MKVWIGFGIALVLFIGLGFMLFSGGDEEQAPEETVTENKENKEPKEEVAGNVYETDYYKFNYPTDWDVAQDQTTSSQGTILKANTNKLVSFQSKKISTEELANTINQDIEAVIVSDEFKTNTLTKELETKEEGDHTVYSYEVTSATEYYGTRVVSRTIFHNGDVMVDFTGVIPVEPEHPEAELSQEEYQSIVNSFEYKELKKEEGSLE